MNGEICQNSPFRATIIPMAPSPDTHDRITSMNVSLPESLREFAEKRASEGYSSVSEYFRDLLRRDRKQAAQARLEELLLEGLDSGEPVEVNDEFWTTLRSRVTERAKKARGETPSSS